METKRCSVCGVEYPLTREHFTYRNKQKGTFHSECIECERKQKSEWYASMKVNNPQMFEATVSRRKRYYQSHKDQSREQSRRWKAEHPKEVRESFNRGRAKRNLSDPVFVWTNKARRAVRHSVMSKGERDNRSGEFLHNLTGLYTLDLRNYLRETFRKKYGYEWDEIEPTHVDHIVPLCTESTIEGRAKLFHYSNLRLLREADNRAKGMKSAEEIARAYTDLPD